MFAPPQCSVEFIEVAAKGNYTELLDHFGLPSQGAFIARSAFQSKEQSKKLELVKIRFTPSLLDSLNTCQRSEDEPEKN